MICCEHWKDRSMGDRNKQEAWGIYSHGEHTINVSVDSHVVSVKQRDEKTSNYAVFGACAIACKN